MDRILMMIFNQVIRRLIFRGVDAGMDAVARRGRSRNSSSNAAPGHAHTRSSRTQTPGPWGAGARDADGGTGEDMTPEQRRQIRETQNRARQMARIARRFTRF